MKKILLLGASCIALFANAQMKEGRVVYERTIQMPVRSFGNIDPEIQRQIPRTRTDQFELLFTPKQSLWQYLPNANTEEAGTFTAPGMVVRFAGGTNDVTFVDFEKGTRLDQREVMERSFLVSDTVARGNWKLSDETKTILNYTARKATSKNIVTRPRTTMENGEMKREMITDTVSVVAWYTTDIPVPAGPDFQGQLPGLILELETNNGLSVYKAIEVSPKINLAKVKEPKGGKKLTAAEFQTEREKLMEEMRRNMPAGNVIRMN